MRSGRSLHASNSDCNFVQSGTYCRPFRKLDGDGPAIEKSERRRVGVRIQIVLLLNGHEPPTLWLTRLELFESSCLTGGIFFSNASQGLT